MKCPHCNRYHVLSRKEMSELVENKEVKIICNECINDFIIFFDDNDEVHVKIPPKEMTREDYKSFSKDGMNEEQYVTYLIDLRNKEIEKLLHRDQTGSEELVSSLNFALRGLKFSFENALKQEKNNLLDFPVYFNGSAADIHRFVDARRAAKDNINYITSILRLLEDEL